MIDNGINNSYYPKRFVGKVKLPKIRRKGNLVIIDKPKERDIDIYYTTNGDNPTINDIRLVDNVINISDIDVLKIVSVQKRKFHTPVYSDIYTININSSPSSDVDYLCFTAEEDGAELSISVGRTSDKTFDLPDFKYSTDKMNWTQLQFTEGEEDEGIITYSSQIFTLELSEKIYFKGLNKGGVNHFDLEKQYSEFCIFDINNGKIAASGDIGTLINEVGGENVELDDFAFGAEGGLFALCTDLTQAPKLPVLSLPTSCYASLFLGCTSLTTAPELPATTLAPLCYQAMFYDCTSLEKSPDLPASTLSPQCYYAMFDGCTFPMSNDGTTFNFEFGATLPQTVGEETFTTHKDVADWMGNLTGFDE